MQTEFDLFFIILLTGAYLVGMFAGYNVGSDLKSFRTKHRASFFTHPAFSHILIPACFALIMLIYVGVR